MTCQSSAVETAGSPNDTATPQFITTDLDLAAYLKTIGRNLIGTQRQGRFVAFIFEASAKVDAQMYLTGATASAQTVLTNYRDLRTLITNTRKTEQICQLKRYPPLKP